MKWLGLIGSATFVLVSVAFAQQHNPESNSTPNLPVRDSNTGSLNSVASPVQNIARPTGSSNPNLPVRNSNTRNFNPVATPAQNIVRPSPNANPFSTPAKTSAVRANSLVGQVKNARQVLPFDNQSKPVFGVVDPAILNKYSAADSDSERREVEKEINKLLDKQFDEQVEREETQLKQLQQRLDRVRDRLEKRVAGKAALVDLRLQQILNQADRLPRVAAGTGLRATIVEAYSEPSLRISRPPAKPNVVASTTPVKAGDMLLIESRTANELNRRVLVLGDNVIILPLVGKIVVAGKTVSEVKTAIISAAGKYYRDPDIDVFLSGTSEPADARQPNNLAPSRPTQNPSSAR